MQLQVAHRLALGVDGFFGNEQPLVLGFFLDGHFSEAGVDLPLPFLETLQRLRQLQGFHLDGVRLLLPAIEFMTRFLQGIPGIDQRRFDFSEPRLLFLDAVFAPGNHQSEFGDFALAFEQAVFGGIRRKQGQALPGHQIAARCHTAGAAREMLPPRQRRRQIRRGVDRRQPVIQNGRKLRMLTTNPLAQAVLAGRGQRAFGGQQQTEFAAWPVTPPGRIGRFDRQRGEPLAQHGLDGDFPACFDGEQFPQGFLTIQMVPPQPLPQLAFVLHPFLQLFERRPAGVRLGTFFLHLLHHRHHLPALLLETRQILLSCL